MRVATDELCVTVVMWYELCVIVVWIMCNVGYCGEELFWLWTVGDELWTMGYE